MAPKGNARRGRVARKRAGVKDGADSVIADLKKRQQAAQGPDKSVANDDKDSNEDETRSPENESEKEEERAEAGEDKPEPSPATSARRSRRTAKPSPPSPSLRAARAKEASKRREDASRGRAPSRPGSAMRESTSAADSSILILQKFQRRPRQPSVLRMVTGRNSDEDDGDEDSFAFDLDDHSILMNSSPAAAKTTEILVPASPSAASRPSTQEQTAQPVASQVIEATQDLNSTDSPLVGLPATDEARQSSQGQLQSTPKRKRSPTAPVFPSSPPVFRAALPAVIEKPPPESTSDDGPLSDVSSVSSSGVSPIVAAESEASDILAPPLSESDDSEEEEDRPAKRQKNGTVATGKAGKKKSLSTSTLTSLLPRPRTQRTAQHESDSDNERARRPLKSRRVPPRNTAVQPDRASKAAAGSAPPATARRTYSRQSLVELTRAQSEESEESDQENEKESDEESEATILAPKTTSKELTSAAKKFAEIDAWSMDFESVSQTTNEEETVGS